MRTMLAEVGVGKEVGKERGATNQLKEDERMYLSLTTQMSPLKAKVRVTNYSLRLVEQGQPILRARILQSSKIARSYRKK